MSIKKRADLKSYFVKNAIPKEGDFADLIDSQLNQSDDGVFKVDGEPLAVVAAPGEQKRVLRLYSSYPAANPDWLISLNPAQTPATPGTGQPGFGIADGAGNTRLFVQTGTGRVGIGTNKPAAALHVAGAVYGNGFQVDNSSPLSDFQTPNPSFNVLLCSTNGGRDSWIYRDGSDTTSNWGIYHRQMQTDLGTLPGKAIAFVGGGNSTLKAYISLNDGSASFGGMLRAPSAMFSGPITTPALTVAGPALVTGRLTANGLSGLYNIVLDDYQTVNPGFNVCLVSPDNKRDAWIYRDGADAGSNWGIYHRQIDSEVKGLPANSIGFVGGGNSSLKAYIGLNDGSAFFAGPIRAGQVTTSQAEVGNLHATGTARIEGQVIANGMRVANGLLLNDFRTVHPTSNVCLYSLSSPTDRDTWVYLDDSDPNGNWGIYHHRNYNAATPLLPANSIAFIGGNRLSGFVCLKDGFAQFGRVSFPLGDVAERFSQHEAGMEAGDVVAIDPSHPERLMRSRSAQQDDLLGVVSEAPGVVLAVDWEKPDAGVPLALAGRVPVKVNLEGGPIRIGDYLTSSSQPGVAMRATHPGRVIGSAMQAFDGSSGASGKVVVFVNAHWFGGR